MKTPLINPALKGKYITLLAFFCCLIFNRAQAQYIPIDSGFASQLIGQNPNTAACIINGNQLDTACAKVLIPDSYAFHTTNGLGVVTSLEGIQYIGKNSVGLSVGTRQLQIGSEVTFVPDLPALYSSVYIYNTILQHVPYLGDSAKVVYITGTEVNFMSVLPMAVETLNISDTKLTQLPSPLPAALVRLEIYGNALLTSLPAFPSSIKHLTAAMGNYGSLPALPGALKFLDCRNSSLTSLPSLPTALEELWCIDNQLTSLPTLPPVLKKLYCRNNQLTSLPSLPASLQNLECEHNQLSAIPSLNSTGLHTILCFDNNISSLPDLTNTALELLDCSHNNLTTLPRLPESVGSHLNGVDGPRLDIFASYNQLNTITNFPLQVDSFDLSYNDLSFLPALGDTLKHLILVRNNISYLPPMPASMWGLNIDSNPIACLPPIEHSWAYVSLSATNISCLPNERWMMSINQLPLCNLSDLEVCNYEHITGRVYYDKNNNCLYDNGDIPAGYRILKLSNNAYAITDSLGTYDIVVTPGIYTIKLTGVDYPYSFTCTDSILSFTYVDGDTIPSLDFPLKVDFDCAILEVDVSAALIRIAIPNTHYVSVVNSGSDTAINVILDVKFDPELTPISSIPTWDNQLPGNVLRYIIGNLAPAEEFNITILDSASIASIPGQAACVMARVSNDNVCGLQASSLWDSSNVVVQSKWETGQDSVSFFIKNTGNDMSGASEYRIYEEELLMFRGNFQLSAFDSITIKLIANGHTYRVEADQHPHFPGLSIPRQFVELAGGPAQSVHHIIPIPQDDRDPWIEIDCHEIVNGYDPNDKQAFPAGVGNNHYITANDELEYQIRFQNTGNDTAFNIRVIDTLDAGGLEIETFRSGISSHPYTVTIHGRVITWRFANILLPDSHVNEPLSHGFVKFKIKQKQGNQPGNVINNYADIYFDYNAPVRTNTAFVTIEQKDRIFSAIVEPRNIENGYAVSVMPNPFAEQAQFSIANKYGHDDNYTFELFDITGRSLIRKQVQGNFTIYRDEMVAGVYLFKITDNGKAVGNGKIMVK